MRDPRHVLARTALEEARYGEAEELYTAILVDHPTDPDALYYLAAMQLQRSAVTDAAQSIRAALEIDPNDARFHVANGQICALLHRYEEAETAFEQALSIDPSSADAYTNLGAMQFDFGRYEEAEFTLRKALIYHPHHSPAAVQLGRTLLRLYRVEEAVSLFHAILQFAPNDVSAQLNIGIGCTLLGDLDSAREAFEAALRTNPHSIEAHVNYAHLLLLQGDFERGYREHEWRLKKTDYRDLSAFSSPLWNGEDLTDQTILLWGEQGLGDIIQFVRFAPLVAQSAKRVIVECHPLLHRLVAGIPGVDEVADVRAANAYDIHLPLMSLPLWGGTENIPNDVPYLTPPPSISVDPALSQCSGLRVGLIWAGNPNHARDRERSRALREFAPLARRTDATFFALQKGPAAAQSSPDEMAIIDLGHSFSDLADTAAAMKELDLVISIDSAPAHLAGALGIPVWVLLTRIPDWRWGLERGDSDWYPSMRLFREENGWGDLFEIVATALVEFSPANAQTA